MDNNRGVKSLQNDRKRVIILTEKQKRKLQEINDKKVEKNLKSWKKSKKITNNNFFENYSYSRSWCYFKINC